MLPGSARIENSRLPEGSRVIRPLPGRMAGVPDYFQGPVTTTSPINVC